MDTDKRVYYKRSGNESVSRKPVVLAVDDSITILKTVSDVLRDTCKVYTLPKPEELENVLKRVTPDLFIIDYLMPEINGFDLVPIIRGFDKHKETPIIFLTSEGTLVNVAVAVSLGVTDFMVKPIVPDVLRDRVTKITAKVKG